MSPAPLRFCSTKSLVGVTGCKLNFGGEWCLSSTFLSLQCDHKCAYATTGVIFHHFSQAFEEKNSGAMIKKDEKSLKGGSCL